MILSCFALIITIAAVVVLKKRGFAIDKKVIAIAAVLEIAGLVFCGVELYSEHMGFDGILYRNPRGEGDREEELIASFGETEYEVTVEVSEIGIDDEGAYGYIDEAINEIEETFLGENESIDHVSRDVVVKEQYADGKVSCDWTIDSHGTVNPDGTLRLEKLEGPTEVTANAMLTCANISSPYEITFTVEPPSADTETGFRYALSRLLEKEDEDTRFSETMRVPGSLDGRTIGWTKKRSHTGEELSIFGIVAFFLLLFSMKEEEKRRYQKRQQALSQDYPDIVGRLSLFVGAGITPRASFEKMGSWYASYLKDPGAIKRPGFEAIQVMNRRMADGISETEGYRLLGEDTAHKDYRKLSLMLCQNLKKGSRDLIDQLEKEERNAYEDRKQKARIAGEEASTKLLIPMLMMLGVLLVVLILPSLWGMGL